MKIKTQRTGAVRVAVVLAFACLAAGLAWGLSAAAAASTSPTPSGGPDKVILRIGWTREPDNLNPFVGVSASCYEIWHLQYDLLNGYDAATLMPKPEFAESWSHSADGLTWTFKIRPGMTWQDGTPATARDVAFTFNYVIDNQMASFMGYTEGIEKVEAPDDTTAVFTCSRPKANMLGMWVPILLQHIWSKIDPKDAGTGYPNKPPIVGSGPFQIVEWKKGSYLRLAADPNYWAGKPKVDEVIFETYQNADTMAQDMKSGALAGAWGIPPAQVESLNGGGVESISYITIGFDQLTFNCAPAPATGDPALRDPAFRKALNYAIDKQKIAAVAYSGQVSPATSMIPAGLYAADLDYHWDPGAATYPFDLEGAKAALDAAGYKDTNGDGIREGKDGKPIRLELLARNESIMSQQSGKFIAGWFKGIGLDIEFQVVSEAALSDKVWNTVDGKVQPDYDMLLWGWVGDADPNFLASISTSDQAGMWNQSVWSDPEYDALFAQQARELDPQKRKEAIWKMQQIVYEQSPFIPLIYSRSQEAYNTRQWTGWVKSPAKDGGPFYTFQTDSYRLVHPVAATTAAGESGSSALATVLWIVAATVGAVVVVLLIKRSRGRRAEES
jgi:peptide/nickel transport system substrate-binding protein